LAARSGRLGCWNFDEMLRLVARHYHLMTETFTLRYQSGPDGTGEAIYTPALTMPLQTLHFYLEALAVAHDNQLRQMLPYGMRGTWDIYVSMSAPEHLAHYSALPQVRFHFDAAFPPGVRVMMPASVLEHPLPFTNPRMVKEIDRLCARHAAPARIGLPTCGWCSGMWRGRRPRSRALRRTTVYRPAPSSAICARKTSAFANFCIRPASNVLANCCAIRSSP
jgi:hypothetical protein